ncbi:MAG: HAD family hydrolase [Candidatus Shapirobacteria bacterium]
MTRLVLLDLGNSLIYRKKSLFDYDTKLISLCTDINIEHIKKVVNAHVLTNSEIYDFSLQPRRTLKEEDVAEKKFFSLIFKELDRSKDLDSFLDKKKAEQRYWLYNGTIDLLSSLKSKGYLLGVLTNGRPSRRRILNILNISSFFEKKYIFVSDEIGYYKPNKEIFEYVRSLSDYKKITLCDDEDINIQSATKLGWDAIKINHDSFGFSKVINVLINNHENL